MLAKLKTVPIRTFIIPTVVVLVVLFHMYGFYRHDRSSWGTGLSFGMFATSECHASRWIVVENESGRQVFDWVDSKQTHPLIAQTLASPTQARIDRCARQLAGNVQLYGTRFDPASKQLRSILIRQSTASGEAGNE